MRITEPLLYKGPYKILILVFSKNLLPPKKYMIVDDGEDKDNDDDERKEYDDEDEIHVGGCSCCRRSGRF